MQLRRLIASFAVVVAIAAACAGDTDVAVPPPQTSQPAPTATSAATPGSDRSEPTEAVSAPDPTPTAAPVPTAEPQRGLFESADGAMGELPSTWDDPDAPVPVATSLTSGRLDNGLRYLIQPNARPGGRVQLRLVVAAGSIHELDGTEGAAHYLEHMLFNGTERFPGNELITTLESFGSGFGADVNAYTSFTETVYTLQVPSNETEVRLGLEVLGEWADRALIAPEAVEAERGVIREEWRRRAETVGGRLGEVVRSVVYAGTTHADRPPIGDIDVIESIDADTLRAFYERWYRPDRMTVVAAGDLDPVQIQQWIQATFAELVNPAERVVEPRDNVAGGLDEPVYDVVTDAELTRSEFELRWRLPAQPSVTRRDVRDEVVRLVATEVLFRRLDEALLRGRVDLLDVTVSRRGLTDDTQALLVDGDVEPDGAIDGLRTTLEEFEQLRQHAVTDDEFERAIAVIRATTQNRLSQSATRQDFTVADALVQFALTGAASADPDVAYEINIEALESVQPGDVQQFFDAVLSTPAHVLLTGPDGSAEVLPAPERLAEVYEAVVGTRIDRFAPLSNGEVPTTLLEAPEPIAPVEAVTIEALNATVVTYPNGVRVAFRPTDIVDNRIEFQAFSRGGFFAEGPDVAPLLGRIDGVVAGSGFESLDRVDLDLLLADSVTSLASRIRRATDELEGATSVGELETLFQLIHLRMTESVIDELAVRRFLDSWDVLAEDPNRRPEIAADLRLWDRRYGESPWFRLIPTPDDLERLDVDAQLQAFRNRFANAGDFLFVFVGDPEAHEAIFDLAGRYLATLPGTPEPERPIDRDPGLPDENIIETVAVGIGDQGRVHINWESPFDFTLENQVRAEALELVVRARLRDVVREQLGASYSPNADVLVLAEPKEWVDTTIELSTDPERIDEVSDTIRAELQALRSGDFDPAYLDLAVEQLLVDYRFFSNVEWIELVTTHLAYPERPAGEYRDRPDIARSLTVDDIAATAQIVFPAERSVEVRMVPAG